MYGVNGQPLSLKWELNLEGKRFWGAEWKIGKQVGDAESRVAVFVDRNYDKLIDKLVIKQREEFGYLDILQLDSGWMKVIEVSANDEELNTVSDTAHIKYLGMFPSSLLYSFIFQNLAFILFFFHILQ